MAEKYCISCMRPKEAGMTVCPHCGFDESQYVPPPMALPPGSTLANGKYLVGRTLGQGGFGVTYLALDQFLELRVAIKEYLPRNMAYRSGESNSLHWHSTVMDKKTGRESFIKEAKKMARIDEIPNVVRVKDVFYENDTAYIVMDYVEGETLLNHLKLTGPLSGADCLSLLRPVMKALSEAHSQGLIHRDISPDNIMLDKRNRVWLLDLGAAKEMDVAAPGASGHTSTVAVYKDGFSPLEQYAITMPDQSGGKKNIGAWTDVYAMSATIFYCMSGSMLPPAPNRVLNPRLELPETIPSDMAKVLVKGLALLPQDRIQTMDELWLGLAEEVVSPGTASKSEDTRIETRDKEEDELWEKRKKGEDVRRQEEAQKQEEEARKRKAEEWKKKIEEAKERRQAREVVISNVPEGSAPAKANWDAIDNAEAALERGKQQENPAKTKMAGNRRTGFLSKVLSLVAGLLFGFFWEIYYFVPFLLFVNIMRRLEYSYMLLSLIIAALINFAPTFFLSYFYMRIRKKIAPSFFFAAGILICCCFAISQLNGPYFIKEEIVCELSVCVGPIAAAALYKWKFQNKG